MLSMTPWKWLLRLVFPRRRHAFHSPPTGLRNFLTFFLGTTNFINWASIARNFRCMENKKAELRIHDSEYAYWKIVWSLWIIQDCCPYGEIIIYRTGSSEGHKIQALYSLLTRKIKRFHSSRCGWMNYFGTCRHMRSDEIWRINR